MAIMTVLDRNKRILADKLAGAEYKQLSSKYNLPESSLRRIVSELRRAAVPIKSESVDRPENAQTDFGQWAKRFEQIKKRKRFVTVMHLSDIHFPYHDTQALSLTYKVVAQIQPDVIVVGSDSFDLPTISRFGPDKDMAVNDWLQQLKPYWQAFINNLQLAAPNALLPFIVGNHDNRALEEIKKLSVPKVVMDYFIDTVRCDNNVMWLGGTSEVEIGNLTVAHGWLTNKYTAASTLLAYKYQRNLIVGHTHRPDFNTVRGANYSVACAVGGCLCQLTPHYQSNRQHTDWQHGTVVAIVDTQTVNSQLHNLIYHDTKWTSIGTQVITL